MTLPISAYDAKHAGEPVAILANGPSLLRHTLAEIPCRTIGLNRSWEKHRSTYHLTIEQAHEDAHPLVYAGLEALGCLFTMGEGWKYPGTVIPTYPPAWCKLHPFSRDLEAGAVIGWDGIGSVAYVALQLAVWMGFARVYYLGLDLGGDHFHGDWPASQTLASQNRLFRAAIPYLDDTQVFVCGNADSQCDAFQKVPFSALAKEGPVESGVANG